MITMGNITLDPEAIRAVAPALGNGIAYMFTWGAGSFWASLFAPLL